MQKQQFLRSKGLTEREIQLACERSGVFSQDPNAPTVINMGINATQTHAQLALQPRPTAFGRIKEVLHSIALIGGVAYAIYTFWKVLTTTEYIHVVRILLNFFLSEILDAFPLRLEKEEDGRRNLVGHRQKGG